MHETRINIYILYGYPLMEDYCEYHTKVTQLKSDKHQLQLLFQS